MGVVGRVKLGVELVGVLASLICNSLTRIFSAICWICWDLVWMSSFSLFSRRSTISNLFTWFSRVFLPSCLHTKNNIRLTTQRRMTCVGQYYLTHLHDLASRVYSGTSVSLKRRFKVSLESDLPRRRSRSRSSRSLAWRTFCSSSVASVLAFTAWGRSGGQRLLLDPKTNHLICLCNKKKVL